MLSHLSCWIPEMLDVCLITGAAYACMGGHQWNTSLLLGDWTFLKAEASWLCKRNALACCTVALHWELVTGPTVSASRIGKVLHSTGGSPGTEGLGWGMYISALHQWIWALQPDAQIPSGSHPSWSGVMKASSRVHPVLLHVQFLKDQRNWPTLSFSFSVWQWGGGLGKSLKPSESLKVLSGLPGVLWMMTQPI